MMIFEATIETAPSFGQAEIEIQNFTHLRDVCRVVAFAPTYRIRSHSDESGRVTSREVNAVQDDGRELYLGNLIMQGDQQKSL